MAENASRAAKAAAGILTAGSLLVVGWGVGHFVRFGEKAKAVPPPCVPMGASEL